MNIFVPITATLAYVIGAIPTGYLIAQLKGINDIRQHGSGNIGATNVSRMLGKKYFFLIFFLDAGKAFLFISVIAPYFTPEWIYFFASLLLFGNGCSLFLRGSGGKGVATLFGLLAALNIYAAALVFVVWLALVALTRTVGIASVGAITTLPIYAYSTHNMPFFLFSLFAATWIIYAHRSNIQAYRK